MKLVDTIKKDKLFFVLMLVILVTGTAIRFSDYAAEGYDMDAQNVLAAAVYWYYPPYKVFPGMIYHEPPLGDIIIGAGCMASGEDFSKVRDVTPLYFPNRALLIGEPTTKAESYCFFPIYLFSVIFLIIIAVMAWIMLGKIPALYMTAFVAYSPLIILWGRRIHVDIILWAFLALGLLFLWLGYSAEPNTKKERRNFILSFIFLGLAGATKYTVGLYLITAPLLFIEKHKREMMIYLGKLSKQLSLNVWEKHADEKTNAYTLKTLAYSIIAMAAAFLAPFKFSVSNVLEMLKVFTTQNRPGAGAVHLSWNFFKGIYAHLVYMNVFDTIVLLFAIFTLAFIIIKKDKGPLEKFVLYLIILQIVAVTLVGDLLLGIGGVFRSVPYMFGLLLLLALSISDRPYSITKLFNVNKKYLYAFLIIYIIFSSYTIYSAPTKIRANDFVCYFNEKDCKEIVSTTQAKAAAEYLKPLLGNNETYFHGDFDSTVYFYLRPETSDILWQMITYSMQKVGRRPTIPEYQQMFASTGQKLRFVLLNKDYTEAEDRKEFIRNYEPNHVLTARGLELGYVYDLDNLKIRTA
ncbi:MAG: phospholipid carrier-dependent glycosyltransferase [Candidatus Woesearchaeota archaeon]